VSSCLSAVDEENRNRRWSATKILRDLQSELIPFGEQKSSRRDEGRRERDRDSRERKERDGMILIFLRASGIRVAFVKKSHF
jgi:hypothetical protein